MRPSLSKARIVPGLFTIVLSTVLTMPALGQVDVATDAPESQGTVSVLVELEAPAAARVYGETLRAGSGRGAAVAAGRAQSTANRAALRSLSARLRAPSIAGREIFSVGRVLNGVAVEVEASKVREIARMAGVKAVHILEPEYPTNSTSVPFIGSPALWGNTLGLPAALTGTGLKVGIIDTGIDYQHPAFGGTGLLADYQANDRLVAPDAFFPTVRVVGGYDFAGDSYNGTAGTIAPDPDPMDCNGHGTHVAGTAAGGGVNADGTPYAGPFGPGTNFASLKIGPGVAPQADLYALRVFGCGGSTSLTVQAIDWAVDPNGDDDFSDRLDVINLSLGSAFGTPTSTTAAASENAALAGVIVVASAGNSGDTFFITGSPGTSGRAISVANSVDGGISGNALRVNAPGGIAGVYAAGTASFGTPAPAGGLSGNVVVGLDPADAAGPLTTDGCSPLTNAAAVAGNIALIDRGTCGFPVKVKNAQDAGAIGVVIANNVAGVVNMGGTDPTIFIPSASVSLADGNTFKANIPGLNLTLLSGADTLSASSSRGPRLGGGTPVRLKPDLAAPGTSITSALTGVTCTGTAPSTGCQVANASGYNPGGQPVAFSGTSMAAPHVAGTMALLRQAHPDWSTEELKALVMNTSLHDVTTLAGANDALFGPGRVGAGRIDLPLAATATAVAFNADDAGLVSVSFESREVAGVSTEQKLVRVVNKSTSPQTFDLSIVTTLDAPGVSFSLPGGASVTVPAASTVTFPVQVSATAAQMDHTREATVAPTQTVTTPGSIANLAIPRHWLTEEAGFVVLSQGGSPKLRVPVYVPPRPASLMTAPAAIATGGAGTGSTTIPLSGTDVCTGTLGAGPSCAGTFPNDVVSLVSPFELQVVSPRDPSAAPAWADIQYAGVATDGSRIWFGISTWGDWSSPIDVSFTVYVDNNNDGVWDRQVFNTDSGSLSRRFFGGTGPGATDAFITSVFTPPGSFSNTIAASTPNYVNRLPASSVDSVLYGTNVMFIGATAAQLGLANTSAPFRYKIETCPGTVTLCSHYNGFRYDEAAGPYTWNGGAQGVDFGGANLLPDLDGAAVPVTWNAANLAANGSLGAILLHHHNASGRRAEVVLLEGALSADLSVAIGVVPASPAFGSNATFTVAASNSGPDAASGVAAVMPLPAGLTYVSDTSGGAWEPGTGVWTIGNLASGGSASIQIVATADTTDLLTVTATIGATAPLDPDPSNDTASVALQAPRSADVEVAMSASPVSALVGSPLTYTITVRNLGADVAYGLNVTELFPSMPALAPVSHTVSQGTFNPATGLWTFPSLGTGVVATLQLVVTAPSFAGALTAQATATATTADPDTANNTASASVTVLSPAVVGATKTVSGSRFPGAIVTYTIVLPNSGTNDQVDNPGDEFVDVLPAGLELLSASATSGTAVADPGTNTVRWNGSIPAGGSVTISIQARIATTAAGTLISNQGTAYFDADGDGTNESSTLTDDPALPGAADPTVFRAEDPAAIPATSTAGLALLGLLVALGAGLLLRSRVSG